MNCIKTIMFVENSIYYEHMSVNTLNSYLDILSDCEFDDIINNEYCKIYILYCRLYSKVNDNILYYSNNENEEKFKKICIILEHLEKELNFKKELIKYTQSMQNKCHKIQNY
jgi:hypothetical protein